MVMIVRLTLLMVISEKREWVWVRCIEAKALSRVRVKLMSVACRRGNASVK